jgi:hypothetical protein
VIVGAADIKGVLSVEPEDHSVLLVDAYRVKPGQVTHQRMKSVARGDPQIIQASHGVQLIQFPPNDRPKRSGNAPSGLAVDAVPDVSGCVVSQRPNH